MNHSKLPWRITEPNERKGREIVCAAGSTIAKLTALDMANAGLIVAAVNTQAAQPKEAGQARELPPLPFTAISTKQHGSLYTIEDMHGYARAAQSSPAVQDEQEALRKLCDQLDGMKRTMFLRPGTGQHYSYLVHEDVQAYVEEARKALASAPAQPTVPEGFALVPIEPTQAMFDAGDSAEQQILESDGNRTVYESPTRACWRAMIAAAAPVAQKGEK